MRTQWNEAEDRALQGLPHLAQLVYLRAIRPYMDYATGIVGHRRGISHKGIAEMMYIEPGQGRRAQEPSIKAVRHAVDVLKQVGLIETIPADRKLVFRLVLADTDQSVQNKWGRRGADPQEARRGSHEPSNDGAQQDNRGRRGADPQTPRWGTPPYTVIKDTSYPLSEADASAPDGDADLLGDAPTPAARSTVPPCPHQEIISLYHQMLPELPAIVPSRWPGSADARALQSRWREDKRHQGMDFWRRFFETVRSNPHWMGHNNREWRANLRWLVKRANFDKVTDRLAAQPRRAA